MTNRAELTRRDILKSGAAVATVTLAEGVTLMAFGGSAAEAAGAEMVVFDSGEPMRYNKENLRNPWFIVKARGIEFDL